MDFQRPFLVGVVHLAPLPGSPKHGLPLSAIVSTAVQDAQTLAGAGFDGLMVENFGDAPFLSGEIDAATIASIAIVADRIAQATELPVGINALRNDAHASLGIAAAVGAAFIRVNVHTGVAATDQGWIEGRAAETLRYRRQLGADIAVFADVHVKHAMPISQPDIVLAAEEAAYRGLADVLIVTGSTTGRPCDIAQLEAVKKAVPDRPVFVGSGATVENIGALLEVSDGVIVGTAIKKNGQTSAPVDADRARAFVDAARGS